MICLVIALLSLVWIKRTDVAHYFVSDFLQDHGYDSTFTIETMDLSNLVLREVEIDENGASVLQAKTLDLQYSFDRQQGFKAENFTLERIEIDGLNAAVNWEQGDTFHDLVMGFSRSSDDGASSFQFPPRGIWIKNAVLGGRAPNMAGRVEFDFTAYSQHNWEFGYQGKATSDDDLNLIDFSGGAHQENPDKLSVFGDVKIPSFSMSASGPASGQNQNDKRENGAALSYPWAAKALEVDYNLTLDVGGKSLTSLSMAITPIPINGWVNLKAKTINSPWGKVDGIMVKGEGNVEVVSELMREMFTTKMAVDLGAVFPNGAVKWQAKTDQTHVANAETRAKISKAVTVNRILSTAPISQHFAPELSRSMAVLLDRFSVNAMGDMAWSEDGYKLSLSVPLRVRGEETSIAIQRRNHERDQSLLNFDRQAKQLKLNADIIWTGGDGNQTFPRLQFSDLNLVSNSENGFSITGLKSMSTKITTDADWFVVPESSSTNDKHTRHDKRPRLGPLDFMINAQAKSVAGTPVDGAKIFDAKLKGTLDYDGPFLGAEITGLKAQGAMGIHLLNEVTQIDLALERPIVIAQARFASSKKEAASESKAELGWTVRDVSFQLRSDVFSLTKNSALNTKDTPLRLKADLQNFSGVLIDPDGQRSLETGIEGLSVDMVVDPVLHTEKNSRMNWNITAQEAQIWSDDFLAKGTHIKAKTADVRVVTQRSVGIDGVADGELSLKFEAQSPDTMIDTENIRTENMSISVSGSPDQLSATYNTKRVKFKNGDIPELPFGGDLQWIDGRLTGEAKTFLPQSEDTPIDIVFNSVGGRGAAKVLIPVIHFTPSGLQPQHLVSSLRGKLADVSGDVSAEFAFEFGGGAPIRSTGVTQLIDLDVGTLVGPFTGVSSTLEFSSIFPLKTKGVQTAHIAGFDPGFPLDAGQVKFEIIPNGVRIDEAIWPVISKGKSTLDTTVTQMGKIFVSPLTWQFGDVENHAVINIEDIDLRPVFEKIGRDKFYVSGLISGALPARIDGVRVTINQGRLAIENGGVIQFKSGADQAAAQANEYAGHGLKALEDLHYRSMELRVNGPLDGSVNLDVVFEGSNEEVLNGQAFLFDIGVEGELANIVRNLSRSFDTANNVRQVLDLQTEQNEWTQ